MTPVQTILRGTILLALSGCGTFGLDQKPDTAGSDSGAAQAPLRIDRLRPDRAPLAGGTEVTVEGAGFEGEVLFRFGNAEVDVTVLDDETLLVTTPEVRAAATVDVEIESDLGEVTLEDAFTFSDEAGGDDGGAAPAGGKAGALPQPTAVAAEGGASTSAKAVSMLPPRHSTTPASLSHVNCSRRMHKLSRKVNATEDVM